jgi:4-hydroxymandelate oxidase
MTSLIVRASRRRFLRYLAGSPLFTLGAISAHGAEAPSKLPDPMIWAPPDSELIKSPKDAINVFDFEPVAHNNIPPAHFGYMASGIDDEVTLRANREGFLSSSSPAVLMMSLRSIPLWRGALLVVALV